MTLSVGLSTAAREAGCCGASCKEDCANPPCPCNLECWTRAEREQIAINKRKKGKR